MNEQLSLAPVARNSPEESLEAAMKVNGAKQLAQVLLCLYEADKPLTDDEIATRCGLLRHSAGTRRGIARDFGLVVKAGRGVSALGNACAVWELTDEGREAARSLQEASAA